MTTKEILVAARKRIEKPANWCQKIFSADSAGRYVPSDRPEATRFCAGGAMFKVCDGNKTAQWQDVETAMGLLGEYAVERGFTGPSDLNDKTDHVTVMKMFDNAIARAA